MQNYKKYIHHPLKSTGKQSEKFTLKFLLFCRTSIITFIITTHGRGICKLFHCYECSTKKTNKRKIRPKKIIFQKKMTKNMFFPLTSLFEFHYQFSTLNRE